MHLDVVTPLGQLLSSEVDEITAPGALGEFGILPGHIPFLSAIRPGVVRWKHGAEEGTLAVGPGFLEVGQALHGATGAGGERVVLLTQKGQAQADIDVVEARTEHEAAQQKLDHWEGSPDDPARAALEAERDWAQARLDAAATAGHAA